MAKAESKQDELTENPSTSEIVTWLNKLDAKENEPDIKLQKHIGEELLKKVFGNNYKDGLSLYTVISKGGELKYKKLVMKKKDPTSEWRSASKVFTDIGSPYNIETLIHFASLNQLIEESTELPKELSDGHKLVLAKGITSKLIQTGDTTTKNKDEQRRLSAVIDRIKDLKPEEAEELIKKETSIHRARSTEKASTSREARRSKPTLQTVFSQTINAVDVKELQSLLNRVQKAETTMRKARKEMEGAVIGMEGMFRDLITEIRSAIKLGESQQPGFSKTFMEGIESGTKERARKKSKKTTVE